MDRFNIMNLLAFYPKDKWQQSKGPFLPDRNLG